MENDRINKRITKQVKLRLFCRTRFFSLQNTLFSKMKSHLICARIFDCLLKIKKRDTTNYDSYNSDSQLQSAETDDRK